MMAVLCDYCGKSVSGEIQGSFGIPAQRNAVKEHEGGETSLDLKAQRTSKRLDCQCREH